MSIIYDALKKSQKKRTKMQPKAKVAKKTSRFSTSQIIALIAASCLFLIVALINSEKNQAPNKIKKFAEVVHKPKQSIKKIVIPKLSLEGVFLSDKETVALINKKAYHLGDNLYGFKVVGISMDNVKLENESHRLTLRSDLTDQS